MEGLRILENSLVVGARFNKSYNKEYGKPFSVGSTVRVPFPQRYFVSNGLPYDGQSLDRPVTTVTIDQINQIGFDYNSVEAVLNMEGHGAKEKVMDLYVKPAFSQLAQHIDSHCARVAFLYANNVVGTLGTNPTNTDFAYDAQARLEENACTEGERYCIISPTAMAAAVKGSRTTFNPAPEITRQWKKGSVGSAADAQWFSSMSLIRHTAGTWQTPGDVKVSGADQSGSTLTIACTTGDTFNAGDRFNIADVYNVNPKTRQSTGTLKQFTILETVTGAASAATLTITPAIVGPGSHYQNVSALPANLALLTLWPGTSSPNGKTGTIGLMLNQDAFALAGVKLDNPKQGTVEIVSERQDPDTQLSISLVQAFDVVQRRKITRIDTLYGTGVLYNDNCAVAIALG